jgi:hypothetical protein
MRRDQQRDISEVYRQGQLGALRVAAIGHVAKRALLETGDINALRRAAERLAPEAEDLTAMIAVAAAVEMTEVITDLDMGW